MSTTIDERVVEMRFDNKQFEAGVQTSLSTLDKLKKSLNLDGAAKGFEELSSAAKNCDMSMLGRSVETISTKFSALETIAVGALLRIGSQAADAGVQLVKSLSIDQVVAGWDKYAEKTASVQTIMNATGKSIDEVNGYLDKLMWFSDETSYGFTDMTAALAQMTSSGGDIDKLIPMITGVANATAYAGKGASEFSRIMYNLNQSYGAGSLQLMDWKSVELAGAGSKELKQILIDTAKEVGTLNKLGKTAKGTLVDVGSFNSTLSEKWATTEVMEKAFGKFSELSEEAYRLVEAGEFDTASEAIEALAGKYSDIAEKAFKSAQEAKTFTEAIDATKDAVSSGWMETFEIIFGNYEEAKVLWTDLANSLWDVFASGAEARNDMLREALSVSGFDRFEQGIQDAGIEVGAFENKLSELATNKGLSLDEIISEYGSLESAIQNGAISTDLLREATANCADEFLKVDGFKTAGYTELMDSLDELIDGVDQLTGRQHLVQAFWNTWEGVGSLLSTFKDAFRDIFPATTAEQLYAFVKGLDEATGRFKSFLTESEEGQKLLTDLRNTFRGLFAVLDIVKQAFSAVWRSISPATSAVGGLLSGVLGLTGSFGDWLANLDATIKENDAFYKGIQKVVEWIRNAIQAVKDFAENVREKFHLPTLDEAKESLKGFLSAAKEKIGAPGLELLKTLFEKICELAGKVRDAISGMKDGVVSSFEQLDTAVAGNKFLQVLSSIWTFVKRVASAIGDLLGSAIQKLTNMIADSNFTGIIDLVNGITFAGLVTGLKKLADGASKALDAFSGKKGFLSQMKEILDGVRGCFEAYQNNLKASTLLKIAGAIAVLVGAIVVLTLVDSEKLNRATGAITMLFIELIASMAIFQKISGQGTKGMTSAATAMVLMSASVLILANAMRNLAELEWEDIAQGLVAVAGCAAIIVAAGKALSNNGTIKGATGFVIFAAALKVLASVCKDLSTLSWEQLAVGLTGVGVLLAEVAAFLQVAKFEKRAMSTATGIVILSAAIKVLASAAKDFGTMDPDNLTQGLVAVGALLAGLALFTKFTSGSTKMVSIGAGLVIVGAAMKVFASAVGDMGALPIETLVHGLAAMAVALAEVTIAMNLLPKNMVSLGTGLVIVGAALEIIANVMGKLCGLSWGEIARGLVAMGGALAELAISLNLMTGTLGGSAALLVASTALLALIPVMSVLGNLSWEQIAKGLLTLAGAFTVIGVAATVLSGVMPAVLGLGAGLALIGVGVIAAAAGLTLMAAGITALAVALTTGATAITAGLTVIVTGIASLIPVIAQKLGEAVIEICRVIAEGAPAIGKAVKAVVLSLVDMFVECVPAIVEGLFALVTSVLNTLVEYTPQIVDALFQFLIGVLEGVARNLPALIQAAVDVFMAFFSGIVDALAGIDTDILLKGIVGIGLLAAIMAALSAVAGLAPGAMLGVLAMGAVIAELALVLAAVGALAQIPGLNWLINEGGQLLQSIGTAIGGFVGGIVGGFMSGVSSQFPQIGTDLSSFMTNVQPFVDGAASIKPEMMDGVKALTEIILLLTAADILEGLTSWFTGGSSLSSFADELVPFGEGMMAFSNTIKGLDADLVNNAAIAGRTLAEMAATLPNSGGVVGFFAGENDMEAFGNQLVPFGEAMMAFAQSVTGLDSDVVVNAATAGKAIAEMASTLPNSGGVVGFFTGENDIDTFGEKLVPFGEAIMAYSQAVAGLDIDAVTNSATAGKAMVELANTLPNSGGAVAFFTGDNNLDDFGAQLVPFGLAIKMYSLAVAGLDVDAVTNSATAGQALVELAKTIPNCGGLVSFFTGDNNIADFGNDIVSFGYSLRDYAEAIKDVKPDVVTASAAAAGALSELATNLPDSSIFDKLFGGDQSLTDFGYDIAGFGEGMGYYYSQVGGIDSGKLSAVITQVWALVDLAEGMKGLDTSGFSGFSSSLNALASAGLTSFISAFDNSSSQVTGSINTMLGYVVTAINNYQPVTKTAMQSLMLGMVSVVTLNAPKMTTSITTMMTGMLVTIRTNGELIKTSFRLTISQSLSILNTSVPQFKDAGKNVTQGFVDGIKANLQSAIQAANQLASVTISAAQNKLQIKSPSKEFQALGMYVDLGLAKGLTDNAGTAKTAATGVGGAIIDAFKKRLKINSPSVVGKDEVGRYIVEGISEGIKKDMTAEEAAAQKAKNIVTAFQKELDKADLDFSQFDMDYKLWEAQEGRNASDLEKDQRKRELLNSKIVVQQEVIDLKKGEYDTLVAKVGENSTEARNAKIEWQQSMLDLIDLQDQLAAIDSEANARVLSDIEKRLSTAEKLLESRYDSWTESNPKATEHESAIKKLEYLSGKLALQAQRVEMARADMENAIAQYGTNSLEALEAESEYNDALKEATSIQNEINTAKSNEVYRNREAASAYYKLLNENWDWMHNFGYTDEEVQDYARSQSGFIDNIERVIDEAIQSAGDVSDILAEVPTKTSTVVTQQTTEALGSFTKDYVELGENYAAATGTGIQNGAPEAGKVGGQALVKETSDAIASDEQKELWTLAASTLVDCFIEGIQNNVERAAKAAAEMAVRAYQSAIKAVQNSSGGSSTSRVLTMGEVSVGGYSITPTTSTESAQAVSASGKKSESASDDDSDGEKSGGDTTYNFTQNNYSPKALDATTIYRQTNNQFSRLGKVVS